MVLLISRREVEAGDLAFVPSRLTYPVAHSRVPTPKACTWATKKSGPALAALNAQIASLQAQADALRKKEVTEVVAKIRDAIVQYGLTAADLNLAPTARKNAKAPEAGGNKPSIERRKKGGPKPLARAVKFKDDQGNTWGEMGKRPAWFKAVLVASKTPEDLLAKG